MFDSKTIIQTKELAGAIALIASGQLKPENLKTLTDNKGNQHIIQMQLFSHTVPEGGGYHPVKEGDDVVTIIKLINGNAIRVALSGKEIAAQLGISDTNKQPSTP